MMYGVILTVVVLVGITVAIVAFERRRAEAIERDLRASARKGSPRHGRGPRPD